MSGSSNSEPVVWKRLELHGFGRHTSLDVAFAPGLTTLVAPNEFGKTTIVAGLAATVFGLPHLSDPTKFGRERFRSWGNPSRFEGTVGFVARDGDAYDLHRNFDSHEVRIVRHASDGAEEIFEGNHNPNARTGTGSFEDHLERLIGMSDREAFQQSFHVAQPLPPPEKLGDEVQRLLSGSGQGTFRSGLDLLEAAITDRTSATGDLGVRPRNLRKDRRLEELSQRIAERERALHEGREAADQAKAVGERLSELEADKTSLANREKEIGAAVRAFKAWLDAKDAHVRQAQEHRDLKRALDSANAISDEIAGAGERIEREWPEFRDVPPSLVHKLAAVRQAEVELTETEDAEAALRLDLEQKREAEAEAISALEAHRAAEPKREQAFDAEDLRELRSQAASVLEDWNRFRSREQRIVAHEGGLARFQQIEAADEPTRELLRNYRWELDRRQRDVEAERRTAAEALAAQEALAAEEAFAAQSASERRSSRRLVIALVTAVASAGLVYAWSANAIFAVLAAVLGAAAGFSLAPSRPAGAEATGTADSTAADSTAAHPTAARPAGANASRSLHSTRTHPSGAPHPTGAPGSLHEGEPVTAQRTLDSFLAATRPFVESFGGYDDPSAAVRDWETARRDLEQERRLQAEHAERVWGVAPEQVASVRPLALTGPWGSLSRYAQSRGESPETVAGLSEWLARQDDDAWDAAIGRAEASASAHAAWQREASDLEKASVVASTQRAQAEHALGDAKTKLARLRADHEAARSEVEDLLERTGRTARDLLERWKAYREAVQERETRKGNLTALLKGRDANSIEELGEREYTAGMDVMRIANNVEALREERPELPPLSSEREGVARRWRELEVERADVAERLESTQDEIFEHTKTRSGLEGKGLVNIAQVELELVELRKRREILREEIDALVIAHHELQAAVADFQVNYRERLEGAASEYVRVFSEAAARRVSLGEEFDVTVVESDGTRVHPGQLSQGTQDQLLLALRLAIADHLADDAPLPLILDDPFLNWDDSRLAQVREALRELGEDRQVILLSHRSDFASWGDPAEVA